MAVSFAVDNKEIQGLQTLAGNGAGLNTNPAAQPPAPQAPAPSIASISGP